MVYVGSQGQLLSLCDFDTILGLPCVLTMLKFVNALMKFTQARNVFMCDYILVVKICQTDLYKMYKDSQTLFQLESFLEFMDVANKSCKITQDQVVEMVAVNF